MRDPAMFMTLLLYAFPACTAGPAPLREQLTPAEISTITGTAMRLSETSTVRSRSTCSHVGERLQFKITVTDIASTSAASREFMQALTSNVAGGRSDQPLRGVGVEARYRDLNGSQALIVARFGTAVVVLSGTMERSALVGLARAVGAHLQNVTHSAPTHPSQ